MLSSPWTPRLDSGSRRDHISFMASSPGARASSAPTLLHDRQPPEPCGHDRWPMCPPSDMYAMENEVSAGVVLIHPSSASGSSVSTASRPAMSRTRDCLPSQATTRSDGISVSPSGPSTTTPVTRPESSKRSSFTECSYITGRSRAIAWMTFPTSTHTATAVDPCGAISRPSGQTSSSTPISFRGS